MATVYRVIGQSPNNISLNMLEAQTFSAIADSDITDYQLIIYRLSDNTNLYDSGKISFTYYDGQEINIIVPITPALATERDLKWTLEVWNGIDSALSREIPFTNYEPPTVSVNVPSVVTSQIYEFTGSYTHLQSISVNRFKYTLYDGLENELDNSDWQFNSSLRYTFENFLDGTIYKIQLEVYDQNEVYVTSGLQSFTVNYTEPSLDFTPTVTNAKELSSLLIGWEGVYILEGNTVGTTNYIPNYLYSGNTGLEITSGANVFWTNININEVFNCIMTWEPNSASTFNGVIFELNSSVNGNKIKVGYDTTINAFYREQGSNKDYTSVYTINTTDVFLISLTNQGLGVRSYNDTTGSFIQQVRTGNWNG